MKLEKRFPDLAGTISYVHLGALTAVIIAFGFVPSATWTMVLCVGLAALSFPIGIIIVSLPSDAFHFFGPLLVTLIGILMLCVNSFVVGHLIAHAILWVKKRK